MRIVSWNCSGAYRRKIDKILKLAPDIAVIQECESLEKLRSSCKDKIPLKSFWFSEHDQNKGEHGHYTYYWHKKKDYRHMLDYCFASRAIIDRISNVDVK